RIAEALAHEGIRATPEALKRAEAQVRFELDRPEIVRSSNDIQRWAQYLQALLRIAGVPEMPVTILRNLKEQHDSRNLWDYVPTDVPKALDLLGERFRLGVVSNSNGTVRKLFSRLGLADHFETIVDSEEEGIEKPDPRLFEIALKRMSLKASDTAYVG